MHQGNWKCSTCGGAITELPFEPKSDKGLTCRDCYFKNKNGGSAPLSDAAPATSTVADDRDDVPPFDPDAPMVSDEPAPTPPDDLDGAVPTTLGERPKFTGNWTCSICGGAITSLPFQPRDTSGLKCIDCFKKSKG